MTDIVERLRHCENDPMWADHAEIRKEWCKEAADVIGQLREMVNERTYLLNQTKSQQAEIERLRKALQQIVDRYETAEDGWPAEDMRGIARDTLEGKP